MRNLIFTIIFLLLFSHVNVIAEKSVKNYNENTIRIEKNLFVSQSEAESVIDDIGKGLDTLTDSTDNTLQSKLQGFIEKVDKVLGGIIVSFLTEFDGFLKKLFLNLQKSIAIK